jgi:hypothetical protein
MHTKGMFRGSVLLGVILLVPVLMLATSSYAFGCDVGYNGSTIQCVPLAQVSSTDTDTPTPTETATDTPTVTATLTITPTATLEPTWTPSPTPKGDSPATARDPLYIRPKNCINAICPDQVGAPSLTSPEYWTWIDANSTIWYKMDDGHSLQLEVWLFANGQKGLSFDVYAPEQKDFSQKPIGSGSFNKSMANIGVDLFYSGRSIAYGIWYLRINNSNSFPVSYSLRFTRTLPTILKNVCEACHIGNMDWGSCRGSMCADLHQLYGSNPQCYNHDASGDLNGGCQ